MPICKLGQVSYIKISILMEKWHHETWNVIRCMNSPECPEQQLLILQKWPTVTTILQSWDGPSTKI